MCSLSIPAGSVQLLLASVSGQSLRLTHPADGDAVIAAAGSRWIIDSSFKEEVKEEEVKKEK